MKLEIVSEWRTSFGVVYERLSCGHSRRKEKQRATDGSPDRDDADSNLPEDAVYCYYHCHETF